MSPAGGSFTLHLDAFDGPLDLLLTLIERQELDITAVSLARVADAFLAHVRGLPEADPELLSEFISVAAKLLLIKSAVLLPAPMRGGDAEEAMDPTDLTERLREYQAIKSAAGTLRKREESGLRSYMPLAPLAPPPRVLREGAGVPDDLLRALEKIAITALRDAPSETVHREQFTIGEQIALLRDRCARGERVSFASLLRGRQRGEVVATFLAVLELLRLSEIEIEQDERWGEILIRGAA